MRIHYATEADSATPILGSCASLSRCRFCLAINAQNVFICSSKEHIEKIEYSVWFEEDKLIGAVGECLIMSRQGAVMAILASGILGFWQLPCFALTPVYCHA